jgi:hypothetical protein
MSSEKFENAILETLGLSGLPVVSVDLRLEKNQLPRAIVILEVYDMNTKVHKLQSRRFTFVEEDDAN